MKISFVIPSRSNAKYFKWAYDSIRKHQGNHEVYICAANDDSQDNTVFMFHEIAANDDKFSYITNPGPGRLGHTILYDRIVKELVKTDIAIIWHADMYLCPGALDEIEKLMYEIIPVVSQPKAVYTSKRYPNYKTIVSLTRIEPPLHPDGPEKYLASWGTEPEQFNEAAFLQWFNSPEADGYKPKYDPPYTEGIFAPWAFFVKDFLEIGGHDPLYRPQSKEDSDIFNRFKLNGCKFIQTWKGCTYHMTCRGSRFNPTLTTPGTNSSEWENHNIKSARNFIRKWGSYVKHTPLMDPIIIPKYYTKFILTNATLALVELLEPWCDLFKTDLSADLLNKYINKEKSNTDFDLVQKFAAQYLIPSITVKIDGNKFTQLDIRYLEQLQEMVDNITLPLTTGVHCYELGSMDILITDKLDRTSTLIKVTDPEYMNRLKT